MKKIVIVILCTICIFSISYSCFKPQLYNENKKIKIPYDKSYVQHNVTQTFHQNQTSNEVKSEFVYITKTGQCYHKGYCSHAKKIEKTLLKIDAIELGFKACYYCCY